MALRLLVVYHSRSGSTERIVDQVVAGAAVAGEGVEVVRRGAFDAGPDDVLDAAAVILATPANFGYMSGALKDFLERVYHPLLDRTSGLPYALAVKGDTDVGGAVHSVERILTGLRWRRVLPPLTVAGELTPEHLAEAHELGAAMAAGMEAGIFTR